MLAQELQLERELKGVSQLGPGHRIAHDAKPAQGQLHYHVIDSTRRHVSGHFFYGRKPPRRIFRGRSGAKRNGLQPSA